jgi:hypothetical protein
MTQATLNVYRRAVMRGHLTDAELAERYLIETLDEIVEAAVHRRGAVEAPRGR